MTTKKRPIKTINCAPSWEWTVAFCLRVIADKKQTAENKENARKEIIRAGKLADLYVKSVTKK